MLRLDDVTVSIAGTPILREVTFALPTGETTLLLGRNGAGKTTTFRTIMGLLPVDNGRIVLDELDLTRQKAHDRAAHGIGYAPEDRRLIGTLTVEENLLLPTLALGLTGSEKRKRLEGVYRLLPELAELRGRPAGALSGGQGKMAALGRALMVARGLLLLDEPFQGLAPALALNYARTLSRIREERSDLTILIAESSPQLLQGLVEHTLYIERGDVSEQSPENMVHATSAVSLAPYDRSGK